MSATKTHNPSKHPPFSVRLNTSNKGKIEEYKRLFGKYNTRVFFSDVDLNEIEADPLTVILHKASQLEEEVIVEDTSLEVEGAEIGVNIRWLSF